MTAAEPTKARKTRSKKTEIAVPTEQQPQQERIDLKPFPFAEGDFVTCQLPSGNTYPGVIETMLPSGLGYCVAYLKAGETKRREFATHAISSDSSSRYMSTGQKLGDRVRHAETGQYGLIKAERQKGGSTVGVQWKGAEELETVEDGLLDVCGVLDLSRAYAALGLSASEADMPFPVHESELESVLTPAEVETGIPVSGHPVSTGVIGAPWSALRPSPLNPRKKFELEALTELAVDIHDKGILQNLVARPHPTAPGQYEIAAGERRYRAVELLVNGLEVNGERLTVPSDFTVPVLVRPMTDRELLETATAENVQRRRMTPMEEAEAFAAIAAQGATPAEIAHKFGYAERTVTRRIQIALNLTDAVKEAFDQGDLTLEKAEIIALSPKKTQKSLLESARYSSASSLKNTIQKQSFQVKHAQFDLSLYKGEIVEDLFGDVDAYFQDAKQAAELQTATLEAQAEQDKASGAAFAKVIAHGGSYFNGNWEFPKADGATGVVYILDTRTGAVEKLEGRIEREQQQETRQAARDSVPSLGYHTAGQVRILRESILSAALFRNPRAAQAIWLTDQCGNGGFDCINPSNDMLAFAAHIGELTGGILRPPTENDDQDALLVVGTLSQEEDEEHDDPDQYNELEVCEALMQLPVAALRDLVNLSFACAHGLHFYQSGSLGTEIAASLNCTLKGQLEITHELLKDANLLALKQIAQEAGIPETDIEGLSEGELKNRIVKDAKRLAKAKFVPSLMEFPKPQTDAQQAAAD